MARKETGGLYQELLSFLEEQKHLASILSLLAWDERVLMPTGASSGRAKQLSLVSGLLHQAKTKPEFIGIVEELHERQDLSLEQRLNLREVFREVNRLRNVPLSLAKETAELSSQTHRCWKEARKINSFQHVQQLFAKLFNLRIDYGKCVNPGGDPYDALLDLHEPGLTANLVEAFFNPVAIELKKLLELIVAQGVWQKDLRSKQPTLAREDQFRVIKSILETIGFDFSRGRFDLTLHPFCDDVGSDDVRLTTHYPERGFDVALAAALHELGHALYDQGLPKEHYGTPLGEACSLAIHESQSLFWERYIGQSREFVQFQKSIIDARHPEFYADCSVSDLYRSVNLVAPSAIRIEADEVSYGLHIIIRFELERALSDGSLAVTDLPCAWNEKYREYLGLVVPDDLTGVLQDIHWYSGIFGYFPTYLFGAMYASDLFTTLCAQNSGALAELTNGHFEHIRRWLHGAIYQHGKQYPARQLIERAIGHEFMADTYLRYLNEKYL